MIGEIILFALISVAAIVWIWVILLNMEDSDQTIIEMDCNGLKLYILAGQYHWEYAKALHDLKCLSGDNSALENQNDYDVTGQGGVRINNE